MLKEKFSSVIYHASTSEMFGQTGKPGETLNEESPFNPVSPYAVSKVSAFYICKYYRRVHGLNVVTTLAFNHESPLRHYQFITRKLSANAARIKHQKMNGLKIDPVRVGNMNAFRDWGHSADYCEAFHKIVEHHQSAAFEPELPVYVLATSKTVTVRDFAKEVFDSLHFKTIWQGHGKDEKLIDSESGQTLLSIDPKYFRPGEVPHLLGSYSKINQLTGWKPKRSWKEIAHEMVFHDLSLLQKSK